MTVSNSGESNVPAVLDDDLDTGLGDFGVEDAVVPRIQIVHKEGLFKDSLSNQTFPTIKTIILGLVKQRILWHSTLDDGDLPMCKSPDHDSGWPNMDDDVKKDKRFPWEKSGFRIDDFAANSDGFVQLPCDGCKLKDWGSHPDGKRPYCTEQYTLPILYDPYDSSNWVPAILTVQKTGIKPLRAYLSGFQRSRGAAYMAVTEIGLDMRSKGSTDYSVPNFKHMGQTESSEWRGYSVNYRQLKSFLEQPPTRREDDSEDGTPAEPADNVARPPAQEPQAPAQATAEETKVASEPVAQTPPTQSSPPASAPADDDDLPF